MKIIEKAKWVEKALIEQFNVFVAFVLEESMIALFHMDSVFYQYKSKLK